MPHLKATFNSPVLTDQEALDVAAYINDGRIHTRPKIPYSSYPNSETKPIDFFQGPYMNSYIELQHTFRPWNEIEQYYTERGLDIHR